VKKILLISAFLTIPCFSLLAQEALKGFILSKTDSTGVEGSHVYNLSNKEIAISNADGSFKLEASISDTLFISNVNFDNRTFIIKNLAPTIIYLEPSNIHLDEVVVNSLPKTASDFRKKVIGMGHQENEDFLPFAMHPAKPKAKIPPLYQEMKIVGLGFNKNYAPMIAIPIDWFAQKLNKKYQSEMKYYKLKAEKEDHIAADKKFNRSIVKELTGLEGEKLTRFIEFLDMDSGYVKRTSAYEIAVYIKEQFETYTDKK
jgi:hypothetical protein